MQGDSDPNAGAFFFYKTGGISKLSLCLKLTPDSHDDIPVRASPEMRDFLLQIEATNPNMFREVNYLIQTAERIGFGRGRQSLATS
jgi:hypothetical protein